MASYLAGMGGALPEQSQQQARGNNQSVTLRAQSGQHPYVAYEHARQAALEHRSRGEVMEDSSLTAKRPRPGASAHGQVPERKNSGATASTVRSPIPYRYGYRCRTVKVEHGEHGKMLGTIPVRIRIRLPVLWILM